MRFVEKAKKEWKITGLLATTTLLDAASTSTNIPNPQIQDLNPITAYLTGTGGFTTHTLALSLAPLPVYILLYHLWATPSTENTGYLTITAIIMTKFMASINNLLLDTGQTVEPNMAALRLATIMLPIFTLPSVGIYKDLKQEKEEEI